MRARTVAIMPREVESSGLKLAASVPVKMPFSSQPKVKVPTMGCLLG